MPHVSGLATFPECVELIVGCVIAYPGSTTRAGIDMARPLARRGFPVVAGALAEAEGLGLIERRPGLVKRHGRLYHAKLCYPTAAAARALAAASPWVIDALMAAADAIDQGDPDPDPEAGTPAEG